MVEGLAGDQYQLGKPPTDTVNPNLPPVGLKTYHIASGNQNFYTIPDRSPWTADQINSYATRINQLLSVAGNNPTAVTALQGALAALQARQQQPQ